MNLDNLRALNFLPQEQLDMAHSHEILELNRYRWLALRFLPNDPPISRLMSTIGMECVHRLGKLEEVAKKMELAACVNERPFREPSPFFDINKQHFFVVDEPMGYQLLGLAEKAARETCMFFNWMLETNATPELHQPFLSIATQKDNEYRLLQEYLQQRSTGSSEDSLTMQKSI